MNKIKRTRLTYYDVAVIKNGYFEIIQVLAISKIDAMHTVEIQYGVIAKDATISSTWNY